MKVNGSRVHHECTNETDLGAGRVLETAAIWNGFPQTGISPDCMRYLAGFLEVSSNPLANFYTCGKPAMTTPGATGRSYNPDNIVNQRPTVPVIFVQHPASIVGDPP